MSYWVEKKNQGPFTLYEVWCDKYKLVTCKTEAEASEAIAHYKKQDAMKNNC